MLAEQKDMASIRHFAAQGDMSALKSSATQLVRTRNQMKRNTAMQNRMTAMDRRFSDISTSQAMTTAMRNATTAMSRMTGGTDLAAMAKIIRDFDRQNGALDERMEMIDEAIDSMCEFEVSCLLQSAWEIYLLLLTATACVSQDQDSEVSDAIGQVLTEMGLDVAFQTDRPPARLQAQQKEDVDIEERLLRLKFQ